MNAGSKDSRKKWGDRRDGRRLRKADPMLLLMPYVMPNVKDATNYFFGELDISEAEKYIRSKRVAGLKGFGMVHLLIAAYVRIVSQKPQINRFVSGYRMYARNGILVSMTVKKELSIEGEESVVKLRYKPGDTADEVYAGFVKQVFEAKKEGPSNSSDAITRLLNHLPRFLLKAVVGMIRLSDYYGIMPRFIYDASPFHASLFVADLGSINLPPVLHHLYQFGDCPLFLTFGPKGRRMALKRDGTQVTQRYIQYSLTIDERICDGFYFSTVREMINAIIANPYQLDNPPEKIVEDIG